MWRQRSSWRTDFASIQCPGVSRATCTGSSEVEGQLPAVTEILSAISCDAYVGRFPQCNF
jgi:hypothetical protein